MANICILAATITLFVQSASAQDVALYDAPYEVEFKGDWYAVYNQYIRAPS